MGSVDSGFGSGFEGGFEPDDFYESFLAPKFHDFTAPEEPIDPDAYFLSKPGMLKKAFAVEEANTTAPKIHKVALQDAPKSAPVIQQQAPPKSPLAAEKTVRPGSAKKTTAPSSHSSPLTAKSLKNGLAASNNSPAQLPMLDHSKPSHGSLKPTSLAKKLHQASSENDDPNSPDTASVNAAAKVVAKPALTRQRSQKAPEETKPALTRQRSQKLEGKISNPESNSEKESSTSQKKEVSKPAAVKPLKDHSTATTAACKTTVKETSSSHQEVKKHASSCTEIIPGSPYSGHHCKNSRCAANDPNFSSPLPTKKYLVAKKGTPGSIRKATTTPHHPEAHDACPVESSVNGDHRVVPKVKGQVALEEAFNKMAIQQVVEKPTTKEVVQLSESEVKDLKEVPLTVEKKKAAEDLPTEGLPLSAENIRDWARNSVNCEEKDVSSSSEGAVENVDDGVKGDAKPSGVDLFLQVASDCLENIELEKLDVPPTKVAGKKRKSGELLPAGASKKANCTSDEKNKAIAKKISEVKNADPSKFAKMKLRRLSVAKRLSVARSRPGVTNPRPFRLRTQERGAVKEKEFIKKVEEYKAAKEGFHSAFQGLAAVEPKMPGKFLKSGHVFAAKRADPKDHKDETKPTIPLVALKAPLFDHPFKPHRSTKKLTVPQEPKFHSVRGSRTCPSHVAVPT